MKNREENPSKKTRWLFDLPEENRKWRRKIRNHLAENSLWSLLKASEENTKLEEERRRSLWREAMPAAERRRPRAKEYLYEEKMKKKKRRPASEESYLSQQECAWNISGYQRINQRRQALRRAVKAPQRREREANGIFKREWHLKRAMSLSLHEAIEKCMKYIHQQRKYSTVA